MSKSPKLLTIIVSGEFHYEPGEEVSVSSIVDELGIILDDAYLDQAVGTHLFRGDNDKLYRVYFEAYLGEIDAEDAQEIVEGAEEVGQPVYAGWEEA